MCTVFTNQQTKPPTRNLPKRNRRGGACVPARTSARRRFHTKNTHILRGDFNDGCALAGRHGRAHRHRPYPLHHIFPHNPHKQNNHLCAIHPNETNRPTRNPPKRNQPPTRNPSNGISRPRAIYPNEINYSTRIYPNEIVGAVPVCPPKRPRSGVSIPKIHA
ncbi:hypothetical protein SAMN02745202_00559, partial [Segatella oulorum]